VSPIYSLNKHLTSLSLFVECNLCNKCNFDKFLFDHTIYMIFFVQNNKFTTMQLSGSEHLAKQRSLIFLHDKIKENKLFLSMSFPDF